MNSKIINVLVFAAGAALGSVVTWKLVEKKYERIAQEEIDSVKEMYANMNKYEGPQDSDEAKVVEYEQMKAELFEDEAVEEYKELLHKYAYVRNEEGGETKEDSTDICVIPPEEYGETYDYDMLSLNYYADGVLADDWDEVVEDIAGTVGKDFDKHFGEYQNDCVHIRNHNLRADYEILRDLRNFSDVVNDALHPDED